jgi:RES domain-containing protein
MGEFQSWNEYGVFADFVKRKARYVLDERSKQFLRVVQETSTTRQTHLPVGSPLWRAQLGHDWSTKAIPAFMQEDVGGLTECLAPHPFSEQRMRPLVDRAVEGRVNAKGIPCMYLAFNDSTAMSEVRPWIGSLVSVAQFTTSKDLRLVDSTVDWGYSSNYHDGCDEPDPAKREQSVWSQINYAFSEPVTRSDDLADYAPTQVLAEAIRDAGYDGVIYESRLAEEGKNLAVFDLDFVTFVTCALHRVDQIRFEFTPISKDYV